MKSSIIEEVGVIGVQTSLSTQELIALKDLTESIVNGVEEIKGDNRVVVNSEELAMLLNFISKITKDITSTADVKRELFGVDDEQGEPKKNEDYREEGIKEMA